MTDEEYWNRLRASLLHHFDPETEDLRRGRFYRRRGGVCELCDTRITWRHELIASNGATIEVGRECIENYRDVWDELYRSSFRAFMLQVYAVDDLDECRDHLRQPVTVVHVLVWCSCNDEEIEWALNNNSEETRQFMALAKPYIERANKERLAILRELEEEG